MTEERKDGPLDLPPPLGHGRLGMGDGKNWPGMALRLSITVNAAAWADFLRRWGNYKKEDALAPDGTLAPDLLLVVCLDALPATATTAEGLTIEGKAEGARLLFPTTFTPKPPRSFRCVLGGEPVDLELKNIPEADWKIVVEELNKRNVTPGLKVPNINIPASYVYPIFGLSEKKRDLPLLAQFYEPQTPLNWAVGIALISATDINKIRVDAWQEVSIRDLEDIVYCLTELDETRHGQHREDILAEVVKLHTTRNWYYEIEPIRVGRAYTKRAVIGSQYAMPELKLVFLDTEMGKLVLPTDPEVRDMVVKLEVKGRRFPNPEGKDIEALPTKLQDGKKSRWQLESIRWRWVQAFKEDLLLTPALEESGPRKGLPKKTASGKVIRKGNLIPVTRNILSALRLLRAEGSGNQYAVRLLIMLAHNLNKTEDGIYADRVFRMLCIPEDYANKMHEKPEDLVARAVFRLKQRDIGALLPGSDEYPRTDPNPDRRVSPYYRFIRSPEYTPRKAIVSKEDALAIQAEYKAQPAPLAAGSKAYHLKADQAALPGLEVPPAPPIPSGADIRAARDAASLDLRRFSEAVGHGKGRFNTWARYERGEAIRVKSIPEEVWERVRAFIAKNKPKEG